MTDREREQLIEQLLARSAPVLRDRLTAVPQTLDEIEQRVEEIGQVMDVELERCLLKRREKPAVPEENRTACPQCGGAAGYRDTQVRHLLTRRGEQRLARRRYYCAGCRSGCVPLDRALGLDRGATTQQVRLWVAEIVPRAPVGEGNRLLARLTGLQMGASTLERIAVPIGAALRQAQRQQVQAHHQGHPPPVERKPTRRYVSIDGIFAPLREPWQKDGSLGSLACRYGACKTAVVYEARAGPTGDEGVAWRAYVASFSDSKQFGPLVATLAHRAGHHSPFLSHAFLNTAQIMNRTPWLPKSRRRVRAGSFTAAV